jgi:glutamine cyclotransferase
MKKIASFLFLFLATSINSQQSSIPVIVPKILRTIPHDTKAFTQGLFYYKGLLYESTGLYGQSSIRVIDPKNGAIIKNLPVADIFAEGCARMDSFLVQLSWRERAALVYSLPSLKYVRSFSYNGEGWGLTSSAASFYMSNGSDTLVIRNKKFSVTGKVAVTLSGKPLLSLNELEYVKGLIYTNVWFDKSIYMTQPKTGRVVKIIDCSSLVAQNASQSDQDVLNGIAYNNTTGTFYITGKNWRYIFEVRL